MHGRRASRKEPGQPETLRKVSTTERLRSVTLERITIPFVNAVKEFHTLS